MNHRLFCASALLLAVAACSSGVGQPVYTYKQFQESLEAHGLKIDMHRPAVELLMGATDAWVAEIDGKTIEVARFDLSTDAGRANLERLREGGYMRQYWIIEGNLALCPEEDHPQWDTVLKAFHALKK